jgi:hypothetical protein
MVNYSWIHTFDSSCNWSILERDRTMRWLWAQLLEKNIMESCSYRTICDHNSVMEWCFEYVTKTNISIQSCAPILELIVWESWVNLQVCTSASMMMMFVEGQSASLVGGSACPTKHAFWFKACWPLLCQVNRSPIPSSKHLQELYTLHIPDPIQHKWGIF